MIVGRTGNVIVSFILLLKDFKFPMSLQVPGNRRACLRKKNKQKKQVRLSLWAKRKLFGYFSVRFPPTVQKLDRPIVWGAIMSHPLTPGIGPNTVESDNNKNPK